MVQHGVGEQYDYEYRYRDTTYISRVPDNRSTQVARGVG